MLADNLRKNIVVVEALGSLPGLQGSDRAWVPAAVCGGPGEAAGTHHMARGNNKRSQQKFYSHKWSNLDLSCSSCEAQHLLPVAAGSWLVMMVFINASTQP